MPTLTAVPRLTSTLRESRVTRGGSARSRMVASALVARRASSSGASSWFDAGISASRMRSEEHTSELQSLMRISYAVFCLKKRSSYQQITSVRRTIQHTSDIKSIKNIHKAELSTKQTKKYTH